MQRKLPVSQSAELNYGFRPKAAGHDSQLTGCQIHSLSHVVHCRPQRPTPNDQSSEMLPDTSHQPHKGSFVELTLQTEGWQSLKGHVNEPNHLNCSIDCQVKHLVTFKLS